MCKPARRKAYLHVKSKKLSFAVGDPDSRCLSIVNPQNSNALLSAASKEKRHKLSHKP